MNIEREFQLSIERVFREQFPNATIFKKIAISKL